MKYSNPRFHVSLSVRNFVVCHFINDFPSPAWHIWYLWKISPKIQNSVLGVWTMFGGKAWLYTDCLYLRLRLCPLPKVINLNFLDYKFILIIKNIVGVIVAFQGDILLNFGWKSLLSSAVLLYNNISPDCLFHFWIMLYDSDNCVHSMTFSYFLYQITQVCVNHR